MIDLHEISILIVDDMESMCKSIRAMLKILNIGNKVRIAFNGREGLNTLRKESTDLVIIDWNMPVMTGIELLDKIREDRMLRDMPIIMITAENSRDIVAQAAESDIDAYILKPLTVKSLGDKIIKVMEQSQNPSHMTKYLKASRDLEEKGDIDEAIIWATEAMNSDPLSSRPIRVIAHLHYLKNDLFEAEKWFTKAAKMNRLDVYAFHYLGEINMRRNNVDMAVKFYEKAMEISPRQLERSINFAKLLIQKKNISKGKAVLEKAFALSGTSDMLKEEIALFCFDNEAFDFAQSLIEDLIVSYQDRYDLMYKLAKIHILNGDTNRAINLLLKIEPKMPDNVELKLDIAKIYIADGRTLRADGILKTILDIAPDNQEAKDLMRNNV